MRRPLASIFCFLAAALLGSTFLRAAEPFLQKDDVIALVGGEDMAVQGESGYMEFELMRAMPDLHLRFRNLAWEGDTVFEQHRELNFPSWEEQLDKIGATVVLVQFGQMESLSGREKIPDFIAAYEALLQKFSNGGKRRIVIQLPERFEKGRAYSQEAVAERNAVLEAYRLKIEELGKSAAHPRILKSERDFLPSSWTQTRDGIHRAHPEAEALMIVGGLDSRLEKNYREISADKARPLLSLIVVKNKLWFDYWRPQNWAFLAGDRTAQPSSRDHLDPSKRWFPPEREQFLPLIEAKEKEIDALAQKLSQP